MSKTREYVDIIINNGKKEDMKKLHDMFEEVLCDLKEYNYEKYEKYKMKLCGMAYNYTFDDEMATEIVEDMKPIGELWDIDTIKAVKSQYNLNVDDYTFYVVMNSLANDYGEIISTEEVETYVKMAIAFINDEDAIKHKVWKYFTIIPKRD